jgi:copper(I)-binding protein
MHLMLIKLVSPLEQGAQISLVLNFEKTGEMAIELPVSQDPPDN